jgi:RNA polymerase sigma-70 factor, ECF subfamily
LLGDSVALHSDGGGKASAVPTVMTDREKIARFFIGIGRNFEAAGEKYQVRFTSFNGSPGVLVYEDGRPATAMSLEIQHGKISAIFAHRNPVKLRGFESNQGAFQS